jgi:antitoxin component of RelBE/YafQ-DinJ toxin-antitoxin module
MKPKQRRKPIEAVKVEYIELRCEQSEKAAFKAAADAAGLPLSGWIRERLRKIARKELEDLELPVAFLDRLSA